MTTLADTHIRPPSVLTASTVARLLAAVLLTCVSLLSLGAESIVLRESYAGNMSFTITGNTMRNSCSNLGSSSATLNLPSGSTVQAAYLYWSGSGNSDDSVTLNGQLVTAGTNERYLENIDGLPFYSNRADITSRINGSLYTLSDMSFDSSGNYCNGGQAYGGWAIVVIYEHPDEPLRVINLFDGFRNFWRNSITLVPNNFVIADNPAAKGGKHAHITWEGDVGNSQSSNGSSEALRFNNFLLTDSGNPTFNQFNSYSNATGQSTDGVDLDIYNIGSYLTAGATSVSTTYSTGQDRVFLSAEIISVPNREVADLRFTAASGSNALMNSSASLQFAVQNNGPSDSLANSVVTFDVPAGLSYASVSGENWQCSNSNQRVSCQYAEIINTNQISSTAILQFNTTAAALGSNTIRLSVSNSRFDNRLYNNSTDATIVVSKADLSNSQKLAVDPNGGAVSAGDVIRYVLQINEASGRPVSGLSLQDTFQADYQQLNIVSLPDGATAEIIDQRIIVSGINLAADETASIIIDAIIANTTTDGTTLDNSATITNPYGDDQLISAQQLIVAEATYETGGNKPLYLYANNTLSRNAGGAQSRVLLQQDFEYRWQMTPAFQTAFELDPNANAIQASLILQHERNRAGSLGYLRRDHDIILRVLKNGLTEIARLETNHRLPANQQTETVDFAIPFINGAARNFASGDFLVFTINHDLIDVQENINQNDGMYVQFIEGLQTSRIILPAASVIEVENIRFFDKDYSDNSRQEVFRSNLNRGLYITSKITDPFGSFDIRSAELSILDNNNLPVINNQPMTEVFDSGSDHKIYQYFYNIPLTVNEGYWKMTVVAQEGQENEIEHRREQTIDIRQLYPQVLLIKSSSVVYDPVNLDNNPKAIPGAEVLFNIQAINNGQGSPDDNSVIIDEEVPDGLPLFVGDLTAGAPIAFINGTAANDSGLTFSFISLAASNDDVAFSSDDGASFNYTPTPDGDGYDNNVTHIRFMPKGVLKAADGTQPQFNFQYKVKVQ